MGRGWGQGWGRGSQGSSRCVTHCARVHGVCAAQRASLADDSWGVQEAGVLSWLSAPLSLHTHLPSDDSDTSLATDRSLAADTLWCREPLGGRPASAAAAACGSAGNGGALSCPVSCCLAPAACAAAAADVGCWTAELSWAGRAASALPITCSSWIGQGEFVKHMPDSAHRIKAQEPAEE